jgi:hypothetical protein
VIEAASADEAISILETRPDVVTLCPPSALLRQFRGFREGRISGSSQPLWSADETEIGAG